MTLCIKVNYTLPALNNKNKNSLNTLKKTNKNINTIIKNKDYYLSTDIIEKDKLLNQNKNAFINNIVNKDDELVRKSADIRHYEDELKILEQKEKEIIKYYKVLEENYFKDNREKILKYRK